MILNISYLKLKYNVNDTSFVGFEKSYLYALPFNCNDVFAGFIC